jgi:uncharacterized protein (TIGR02285 family)
MRIPLKALAFLALLLGSGSSVAHEHQVTWALPDWAGFSNFEDGQPVDGLVYEALRLITTQLPEYQHSFRLGNVPRAFKEIAAGEPTCFGVALATAERDRVGYYTELMVLPPVHLITRPELAERLQAQSPLSLRQVLRDPALHGVVTKGRLYGGALQPLLHDQPPNNLQLVHSPNLGANLTIMVARGRADYTLEYPLPRLMHASGPSQLKALPIEETGPFAISGIYCAKNPWGQRLVQRFKQAVTEQARQRQAFLAIYERWLPAEQLPGFQPHISAYLERRAKVSKEP